MFRLAVVACLAGAAWAQAPGETIPPGVDEALRARMREFYHYFEVDQPRKAEKLIAEDSQDFFYSHNKPHYLSTEIQSISYSDHFTRARALVLCEQFIMQPGFAGKAMKVPTSSTWKLVDGQWYWYVDPEDLHRTPFGVMTDRGPAAGAGTKPGLPDSIPTTPDFALNLVKVEPASLQLKPGGEAQVTIRNTARGPYNLRIEEKPAGIEATLSRDLLLAGEKATLTVKAAAGAKPGRIALRVVQSNELIPIAISLP
jgi:hypothetical protein